MIDAPATRAPVGSACPICERPMDKPVRDHCHTCDYFMDWVCGRCNTIMTETMRDVPNFIERLAEYHDGHECAPALFEHPRITPRRKAPDGLTEPRYFSNGGGDGRYYSCSRDRAMWTCEQFAAALGVNANTARVLARQLGAEKVDGTYLVPLESAITHLQSRSSA